MHTCIVVSLLKIAYLEFAVVTLERLAVTVNGHCRNYAGVAEVGNVERLYPRRVVV